jgi:hypothetical protein
VPSDTNFINPLVDQKLTENLISAPKTNDMLTLDELFFTDKSLWEPLLTIVDKILANNAYMTN